MCKVGKERNHECRPDGRNIEFGSFMKIVNQQNFEDNNEKNEVMFRLSILGTKITIHYNVDASAQNKCREPLQVLGNISVEWMQFTTMKP